MIVFTEEKKFSREDVQELFLSVGWISGQYPGRLFKALMNSSTVVTAWDGDRLAGLVRVLDDSEMVAYMHYVLVHPAYQGRGIAGKMVEMVKEKYRDYLYLEIMPEESRNAAFYEKHGFRVMERSHAAVQLFKQELMWGAGERLSAAAGAQAMRPLSAGYIRFSAYCSGRLFFMAEIHSRETAVCLGGLDRIQ